MKYIKRYEDNLKDGSELMFEFANIFFEYVKKFHDVNLVCKSYGYFEIKKNHGSDNIYLIYEKNEKRSVFIRFSDGWDSVIKYFSKHFQDLIIEFYTSVFGFYYDNIETIINILKEINSSEDLDIYINQNKFGL
jgi:hypothetical protein